MIDLPPSERRLHHRRPFRNHSSDWPQATQERMMSTQPSKRGGPISMDVFVAMSAAKTTQSHCSSHQQCQRPFQTKSVFRRPLFQ